MSRLARGVTTLMNEVRALRPDAEMEPYGDPDGFGAVRSAWFGPATAEWLEPVLALVEDSRIVDHRVTEVGNLIVDFAGDATSESRDPFQLKLAVDQLAKAEKVEETEKVEQDAPAKKTAAKKAAAKKAAAKS